MLLKFRNLFFSFSFILSIFSSSVEAQTKTLRIGAIPDQNQELLDRRFNLLSEVLSNKLDVKVKYLPVIDYVAAVTAFRKNDLDFVWFGGLSGVQARLQTKNSIIIAQRDIDREFKSVFIVNKKLKLLRSNNLYDLEKLKNLRFTFGSENSTSGRLMPEYFMNLAGLKISDLKGKRAGFSGSHDTTIALVNSGSFDAGVLNKQVWDRNVKNNFKRTKNINVFFVSPEYPDYHWVAQGDLDEKFYEGFTSLLKSAILNLDENNYKQKEILELFGAKKFVEAYPSQYKSIESIARKLKKIK